ncbi:MAG: hypothetical protein A2Z52_01770 [Candidatus Moranbacteria bacterium RBG_19FT_COMBO_42_6]|nr:MAG: hypothetical protein A2Z52_01770 [Candidatus Moranbacteria bacterium RBG_19FT_COMBO_42_6]
MNEYEIINANAERVAKAIHSAIGEERPSVLSLTEWIEKNFGIEIKIKLLKSLSSRYSGLVYPDSKPGVYRVGINANDAVCRQQFTKCHELAHIVRNFGLKYGFSCGEIYTTEGLERFCDQFAASFLMPEEIFIREWKKISDKDLWKRARISRVFNVSGQAVYHRAKELKLI